MPDIENAIEGVPSLGRKRDALARVANENFSTLPNWMKSWTFEEGEIYLDSLDFSNPIATKATFQKVWQMCVTLRDVLKLYQEED